MIITSRENKIYKNIRLLKDKKQRDREGLFIVEGLRGVRDAMNSGLKPKTVVLCEDSGIEIEAGEVFVFAKKLFAEAAETQSPQGILAVFPMPRFDFSSIQPGEKDFVVLCEDLRDPGNLGTIIRTADAAGAAAVVLTKGCCDLYNPKTVRSTVASIGNIPIIRGIEPAEAVKQLKKMGFTLAAGALTERSESLYKADLSGKIAFVIGNEANGVSPEMLSAADKIVKIPMRGGAESLNAAIAAGIMMYEKVRRETTEK